MGSSETGGGLADSSVRSIVWVRRRNGSWWPGKILGPEELSSSHITSPRSGTPVKLLGREDASVDWYNLEKSKRVKAFRCGDFDDCIERAEAAQSMPPKKREKYARREDAIMHALELEKQLLEKTCGKLGSSSNARSKRSPDAVTSSIYMGNGSGNQNDSRLNQLHQRVGSSLSEKNTTNQDMYETVRDGNHLSGDDNSAGALPRMRGLRDFGLRTTMPRVAFHAKRSRNAYMPYDSVDYLIDDQTLSCQLEIPVSKIEQSSYQADMGEIHISGSTEDTETDCSEADSLGSDSDDEMTAVSGGSASIELQPKYPRRIEASEEHASVSSCDGFDELAFADSLSHPYTHSHVSTNAGGSKWQHKVKRNDHNHGDKIGGYMNGKSSYQSHRVPDFADLNFKSRISRYGPMSSNSPYKFAEGSWGSKSRSSMRGYWDDSRANSVGWYHVGGGGTMLIDVDLKVQANNYRRDVALISLMSKLNGHAIVGHPIKIQAHESGLTETYVSSTDYFAPNPAPLTSMWRTGRRTANSRVPRPFLSPMLNGEGKGRDFVYKGSNQKIRTLSSFASRQRQSDWGAGGLIKNGNTRTMATCIPVNLVFSHLCGDLVGRHL